MVNIKETIIDQCDYCEEVTEVCFLGEYKICRNCTHYTIEARGLQDERKDRWED